MRRWDVSGKCWTFSWLSCCCCRVFKLTFFFSPSRWTFPLCHTYLIHSAHPQRCCESSKRGCQMLFIDTPQRRECEVSCHVVEPTTIWRQFDDESVGKNVCRACYCRILNFRNLQFISLLEYYYKFVFNFIVWVWLKFDQCSAHRHLLKLKKFCATNES